MWYTDIADLDDDTASAEVAEYFDVCPSYAREVVTRCRAAYADGRTGVPSVYPRMPEDKDCDCAQCQLVKDAHDEGLLAKDRLTVTLDSETDGFCADCGSCVAYHDETCPMCESKKIERQVLATIPPGLGAERWADHDQTIEGTSWEGTEAEGFYAILINRKGLVEDLRAEGYVLDLTAYEEPTS